MPPPIRVLLIGTGFGAQVHAPGFARNAAFTLAGIASGSIENARRVASEFAIPYATDDWKRMLDEVEGDLVSIATPVDLHYPMARASLERGRHVLCEKPFALNAAEARELAALAKTRGRVAVVNHEFRHFPARETLTRKIREGALGRVEHVMIRDRIPGWARNSARRITWLTDKKRGGGYLGALGSHHIDQLILWGGPIRKVFCTLRTLAAESMTALDGYRLGRPREDGSHEGIPIPEDLAVQPTPVALLAPFLVKLEMLRAAIQEGKPASPDFEDAVEIQKVLDAAR